MSMTPWGKDRLGALFPRGSGYYATDSSATAIPNGESIIVLNHLRINDDGVVAPVARYYGLGFYRATGSDNRFRLESDGAGGFRVRCMNDSNDQFMEIGDLPRGVDICVGMVLDRDNTMVRAFQDGILLKEEAIIRDPDLSASNRTYASSSTTSIGHTIWRAKAISLKAGACPTGEKLATILRGLVVPEAPLPDELLGDEALGSYYSDYPMGEGVHGAIKITDQGTNSDDLAITGASTIEELRVRARVPQPRPEHTWYSMGVGRSASTGAVDFGFEAGPMVLRLMLNRMVATESTAITIANAAVTESLRVYNSVAWGGTTVLLKTNNLTKEFRLRDSVNDDDGGDLFLAWDETDLLVFYSGQYHGKITPVAGLDLSGECTYTQASTPHGVRSCLCTAWNPLVLPATFEEQIRACVMDPEHDPSGLEDSRIFKFDFNSDTMPLGTETTVDNPWGPGTLTLSAQRSDSCEEMIVGYDP